MIADQSWREQAACQGKPTHWFFDPAYQSQARTVCEGCPVLEQCQRWAVSQEGLDVQPFGFLGGLSLRERRRRAGRYVAPARSHYVSTMTFEERLAAKPRPECPRCRTKQDVNRYRKTAGGRQVWIHLPCKTKILEEEAA